MTDKKTIAGILLAAGGSSRLGMPKQLVEFRGQTLIRRAAESLIFAECDKIVIVLGSEIEGSRRELRGLNVEIVENANWSDGMAASIKFGIEHLEAEQPDAVLISLCDQPLVDGNCLSHLIEAFKTTNADIVAARYDGVVGVPAIFSRAMFKSLAALDGDKGARELIRENAVVSVEMPDGKLDLDSASDWNWLTEGEAQVSRAS